MMHTVPKAWEYIRILRGYDPAYDRSAAFSALKLWHLQDRTCILPLDRHLQDRTCITFSAITHSD